MAAPKRLKARKLLITSIGVAAVSYVGCGTPVTSGNLMPPPPCEDAGCGGAGGGTADAGCTDGSADAGCK